MTTDEFKSIDPIIQSRMEQLASQIDGKLTRQTTVLIVWMFASFFATIVCTTGLVSVLLKLSLE